MKLDPKGHLNLLIMESHLEDQSYPVDIWKDLAGFVQIRNGKYQGKDAIPSQFHQRAKLSSDMRMLALW